MIKKKYNPYLVDIDRCVENLGNNRFNLILIAATRVRELRRGHQQKIPQTNSSIITALKEIEEGYIGRDYLKKV
jgi:DNA-directed RNA polymerase omega subunit